MRQRYWLMVLLLFALTLAGCHGYHPSFFGSGAGNVGWDQATNWTLGHYNNGQTGDFRTDR